MRVLVTGCAGFIGSAVAERLLGEGREVIGIDCFTDYYERWIKERNLARIQSHKNFRFIEADLAVSDLTGLIGPGDAVVHLAAQAGVRASWGALFDSYTHNNISATQRLLEAVKDLGVSRFVYAGSSSIYGDALTLPTREDATPKPISPYGVTKLAGEHLCSLYWKGYGVPAVSLRYFTVFGPGQRPDMAFHKWCRDALLGKPLIVFDDGEQTRDFTYVSDIVDATVAAMSAPGAVGENINVGGGNRITVREVLVILEGIHGKPVERTFIEKQKGDVRHTCASIEKAVTLLGYSPRVRVPEGLAAEYQDIKRLYQL